MKVFVLFIVAILIAAANADEFLDKTTTKTSVTKAVETSPKPFAKVDVDRSETINDGKSKKYDTTTETPVTTSITPTTTVPTTEKPKTTTTPDVPLDDHTTEKQKSTTEKLESTTAKTTEAPQPARHVMRWVLGGIFCAIAVVILSLYAYKFYVNRTESSYQNL